LIAGVNWPICLVKWYGAFCMFRCVRTIGLMIWCTGALSVTNSVEAMRERALRACKNQFKFGRVPIDGCRNRCVRMCAVSPVEAER